MATAARLQAELARAMQDAERPGKRLATLTVEAEIQFVSPSSASSSRRRSSRLWSKSSHGILRPQTPSSPPTANARHDL
jgi:hypothetical protein